MKAGLIWPRGRVHMSDKSNPVFQECCFFTGSFLPYRTIFCCAVVRSERVFFNNAHRFKHIALLKGMLYVNNNAYIAQKYWLFLGVLILRKEDQTSRHAHWTPSTGMVQLFKEYFIFCLDTALPQRNIYYSYSEGYVCFEYRICWQTSSIFCRNCVLLKGRCSSIYLR